MCVTYTYWYKCIKNIVHTNRCIHTNKSAVI